MEIVIRKVEGKTYIEIKEIYLSKIERTDGIDYYIGRDDKEFKLIIIEQNNPNI